MFVIPGQRGKDLCDGNLGVSRRDLLRVGGAGMLGMSLGSMFQMQAQAKEAGHVGGAGWGKAKSIILIYLQGGPSHLDLWDPKENVPEKVKSAFKSIPTKLSGVHVTENMPKLAQINELRARIVELRFFAGMTVEEVAEGLGMKGDVDGTNTERAIGPVV